ncbi:MAG: hypothetical protein LKG27_05265 [Clostridiaceae bacterium]|jgi:hypothetical protein|nr:hypothetical protein [Clostridiaceae bacterium]
MVLIAFANIVFSTEVLSLFSQISQTGMLIMNTLTFLSGLWIWNKFERPLWHINCKPFFKQTYNALKMDKALIILAIGFTFFIASAIFLCTIMPIVNPDAAAYHVLRSVFWIQNKNLNHFLIADSRNLCLPINSEILYAWVIMLCKKEIFLGYFSFIGYVISIISTYKILDFMKYSMRKKLWVIFILSSFASVIVQASGTETDIIITGLVSSSLLMFWYAIKNDKLIPLFMSALSYALAIGTKTPSLFAIPAISIAMIIISTHYRKKNFYKPLLLFLGFGIVNFLIFSSYNYILNFIDYGNIAGSNYFLVPHKNFDGIKAIPANFIKYIFLYFDFTGFKWGTYSSNFLLGFRDSIISSLNLFAPTNGLYSTSNQVNQSLLEPLMGLGVLGILVFLPCWILSIIKPIFKHDKRTLILGFFGLMLILNIFIMSYAIQFMTFSVRFLMFFSILSAPILTYSYKKRGVGKVFVILFAIFYMTLVSSHLWSRNISKIINLYHLNYNTRQIRQLSICISLPSKDMKLPSDAYVHFINMGKCSFINYIKKTNQNNKILLFANTTDELLEIKMLNLHGYNIDTNLIETIKPEDLKRYNMIITTNNSQVSTTFFNYAKDTSNPNINCTYHSLPMSENNIPYISRCQFENDYFKKNNFRLYNKIPYTIASPDINRTEDITPVATVYENLAKPIIK